MAKKYYLLENKFNSKIVDLDLAVNNVICPENLSIYNPSFAVVTI